jgi:hypothetical protein
MHLTVCVHDFIIYKVLKDVSMLTSYISLDALTSNFDILFKMNSISFI